jgi:hypothetical protein
MQVYNPNGFLITSPGLNLTNFYEKEIRITFNEVNIEDMDKILYKLLVKDLEIAQNLDLKIIDDTIYFKLTEPKYIEIISEPNLSIPDPFSSSFALAFTRCTNQPIIIENIVIYEDGNLIEIQYKICGE